MDKPKTRKLKTIQMKYPAPYSMSFPSPEAEEKAGKSKRKMKKNLSFVQQPLFPGCCRRNKAKEYQGPNPYAPHLKYGIFPKARSQMKAVNSQPIRNTDVTIGEDAADGKEGDNPNKKDNAPMFVIRHLDKKHRRHLSQSDTLHLDIKPRRYMLKSLLEDTPRRFYN